MKSLKKGENLQKRDLRFLQKDYHSSYETLLHKSGKKTGAIEADGAWVVSQVWPKVYAPTKGVWYFG